MELFGLTITGEHARIVVAFLGGLFAAGGFLAGHWSAHMRTSRFKREDLVTSSVVIELYGIKTGPDGRDTLHIITQGSSATLERFFHHADLVRHVRGAAVKHPGLLHLPNPIAHRLMMDEGKDTITGLDARANMDFIHGRPTQDDETLFAFAAYPENGRGDDGLREQVARLVLMVASPQLIQRLADKSYVEGLAVAHAGYLPRCQRLHDFALEWQRLQSLPAGSRSTSNEKIRQITVRTWRP